MPSFYRIVPIAAAILVFAPSTVWADVPCPTNDSRQPDSPPYPTITSYTVTRSTAPAADRASGAHEATVIGGDPVEGEMRVDMTLSRDLPRNCPLTVELIDPAVSDTEQRAEGGDVAKVFKITAENRVQTMAAQRTYFNTFRLSGDGTNRLVMHAQTRAQFNDHTARLALRIMGRDETYPFTLIRRGLPDIALTASANATRFGSTVEVNAALPFTPIDGAIDNMVTFAVSPAGAGNFRRPNQLQSLAPTMAMPLDADLTPRRAMVIFVPSAADRMTTATLSATLMGRVKKLPITILPVPRPCKPVAAWTIVKGGVDLTLTNIGELPCPELEVNVIASFLGVPTGRSERTSRIFSSPEVPAQTGFASRSLVRPTPPPPSSASEPTSWTKSYSFPGPYPAAGFTVTATVRPSDGSFPTITLPPFAVPAGSMGSSR